MHPPTGIRVFIAQATDIEILGQTRQALKDQRNVLLVIDNADDLDLFRAQTTGAINLSTFLPSNADILLTTYQRQFLGFFAPSSHGVQVRPLEYDEAEQLLISSVPEGLARSSDHTTVDDLITLLAGLPLAIAQAAANVRELHMSLPQYVRAYRNKRDRIA